MGLVLQRGSQPGKGARGGMRGMGNKVSFDKELMWVRRMVEGDRRGAGKNVSGGIR